VIIDKINDNWKQEKMRRKDERRTNAILRGVPVETFKKVFFIIYDRR
jgi:hypothetical protein